jgi:hypothetical protein
MKRNEDEYRKKLDHIIAMSKLVGKKVARTHNCRASGSVGGWAKYIAYATLIHVQGDWSVLKYSDDRIHVVKTSELSE